MVKSFIMKICRYKISSIFSLCVIVLVVLLVNAGTLSRDVYTYESK